MTIEIQPFNFSQHDIRTALDDKLQPWFVAKDICDILDIKFYRDAVSRLDDDERGWLLLDTLGGKQRFATVNESGLYGLIFSSRKNNAKKFRKWVTSEVLPAIRKQGYYSLHQYDPVETASRELWHAKNLLKRDPFIGKLYKYLVAGLSYTECAKLLDVSTRTIKRRVDELACCGLFRFGGQLQPGLTEGKNYSHCCVLPKPGREQ